MPSIFQPTKPTWYLFVGVIAFVALVITLYANKFITHEFGNTVLGVLVGTEVIGLIAGIYFHFSYFWNAGPAGKAVVGYELFNDAFQMLIGRGR